MFIGTCERSYDCIHLNSLHIICPSHDTCNWEKFQQSKRFNNLKKKEMSLLTTPKTRSLMIQHPLCSTVEHCYSSTM